MEANQEKRDKYQEAIKDIPHQSLVYIDESGIELTICKDRGWGKKGVKLLGNSPYAQEVNLYKFCNSIIAA